MKKSSLNNKVTSSVKASQFWSRAFPTKRKSLSTIEGEEEGQGRLLAETRCFKGLSQLVLMIT